MKIFYALLLLVFCQTTYKSGVLRYEPLGFGAKTIGGTDGEVLYVTNLDDRGHGSFRWACEAKGARKVIFEVNGLINLKDDITIQNSHITIDGSSSPNNGVLITGAGLRLKTSEIIIRGIRIRPGKQAGKSIDAISIVTDGADIKNIMIDHCSFSWATDENIGINALEKKIRNVTIQNCIVAEGLLDHSMGLLVNKKLSGGGVDSLTIIQNLFAHNSERNPMIGAGGNAEVINNVVYNWQYKASDYYENSRANIIGNFWKSGHNTKGIHRAIELVDKPTVFLAGNIGPNKPEIEMPEINLVNGTRIITREPVFPPSVASYLSAFSAYDYVILNAGAFPRDSTDRRIIEDVKYGTGKLLREEAEVEGFKHF